MLESFEIEGGILRRYRGDEAHVVIPAGVTRIGESAFEGCEALASVARRVHGQAPRRYPLDLGVAVELQQTRFIRWEILSFDVFILPHLAMRKTLLIVESEMLFGYGIGSTKGKASWRDAHPRDVFQRKVKP